MAKQDWKCSLDAQGERAKQIWLIEGWRRKEAGEVSVLGMILATKTKEADREACGSQCVFMEMSGTAAALGEGRTCGWSNQWRKQSALLCPGPWALRSPTRKQAPLYSPTGSHLNKPDKAVQVVKKNQPAYLLLRFPDPAEDPQPPRNHISPRRGNFIGMLKTICSLIKYRVHV